MKIPKIATFFICLAIPLILGAISGAATATEVDNWFSIIQKPSFTPPNSVFGLVWTVLYILMGISLYLIWISPEVPRRTRALRVFALQLLLNFWWSLIFFSFQLLFVAIVDIALMWVLILYMIILFWRIKPIAGIINIPYILWVSFATVLNVAIWWLNLNNGA